MDRGIGVLVAARRWEDRNREQTACRRTPVALSGTRVISMKVEERSWVSSVEGRKVRKHDKY